MMCIYSRNMLPYCYMPLIEAVDFYLKYINGTEKLPPEKSDLPRQMEVWRNESRYFSNQPLPYYGKLFHNDALLYVECTDIPMHYVYHIIAEANAETLSCKLKNIGLNYNGTCEILRKRMKQLYKLLVRSQQKDDRLKETMNRIMHRKPRAIQYYCIVNFEATVIRRGEQQVTEDGKEFVQEIIAINAVLLKSNTFELVSEFQTFVKPIIHPKLLPLCIKLTRIKQCNVDNAPEFPKAYESFTNWLMGYYEDNNIVIACDGNYDFNFYLKRACQRAGLPFPKWLPFWLDIRKLFQTFYQIETKGLARLDLYRMTLFLSIDYYASGEYAGVNAVVNGSRILKLLYEDGCKIIENRCFELQDLHRSAEKVSSSANINTLNPVLFASYLSEETEKDPAD